MDPSLYRAAMEGNIDFLTQNRGQLEDQVTPNKNTVLHVAALFGKSQCVGEILTTNSSLLCRVNVKGDTALHVAAREGHSDVVKALIGCAKAMDEELESGFTIAEEMLEAKNEDRDTALHDAVRNNRRDVVRLLIKAGPEFTYAANSAGETPLYLAVEKGYSTSMSEILRTCREPAYGGPGGRTALHPAVMFENKRATEKLLDWRKDLAKKPDMYGWTPLHYAARFNRVGMAKQLLDLDKSIAYLPTAEEDDKKTALHMAASRGHVEVMEELISQCPDCWEMVNGKGQNILHVAAENGEARVIEFILKNSSLNSLVNQKDIDGNTPLHLLLAAGYWAYAFKLMDHPRVDMEAYNKENWNPFDLVAYYNESPAERDFIRGKEKKAGACLGWRNVISIDKFSTNEKKTDAKSKKEMKKDVRKTGDTHLIVAALIATVTFAAGFTVPGGYDGNAGPNQGMAILTREAAFKAFVVTNTIAMMLAIGAVFIYFLSTWYDEQIQLLEYQSIAGVLVLFATGAMVMAFITGSHAVLEHSLSLAISVCVIGCVILLFVYGTSYLVFLKRKTGPGIGLMKRIRFGVYNCCR